MATSFYDYIYETAQKRCSDDLVLYRTMLKRDLSEKARRWYESEIEEAKQQMRRNDRWYRSLITGKDPKKVT